ncbi:putative receptor-like protein kinase [Sesamum alatum]|uniref:non-specific serine/threonine protein kinase n=1 Tax=Sesamum alatum TaxID=300844 RepID=A0AAE1YUH9_9LAMI|nr:putative receptor-like protein kinase [Sesamum alatum]
MPSKECILFCFHLIFLLFLHCSSFTSHALDSETDRLSLLSFKDKITDDPLNVMSSWNDSVRFCEWQGVTCSSRRARVATLALPFQKLGGSLSPAIANLTFLRVIDLRGNVFRGPIPAEIGHLFRLRSLLLMENSFGGEIPANLSQCTQLEVINLNYNSLIGKIPTELSRLPNLVALHISANHLTGGIPPVLGNISSLVNLSIAQNYLDGPIPDDLGRLVNLQFLQVGANNLSGTIPLSVFNLSSMSIFAVAFNHLVGNLPSGIGSNFPNLKQLLVGVNGFSGNIPSSLSNISSLQFIDLPDNQFVGRVPSEFGRIANLQRLNVGRNLLGRGDSDALDFINSLTNCSKFEMLGIDSNHFSGPLPDKIANLSINMNRLLLGGNQLSGRIPAGITKFINLIALNVSWNSFDGPILPDIGKLFNLGQLYMNGNRFSGRIPSTIGNLTKLFELRLDGNTLETSVPSSLGNCQQLQLLNLSDNNLSGPVPVQIFTLSSLTVTFNLARNSLSGTLPVDVGNFVNLKELDLSDNELFGSIPDSLGRCLSLEHVYLQRNSLNGSIPSSLSSLKGLQNLDLSRNNLTGSIPQFLQDFRFLGYLNLSFNHFEGEAPKNGVFANRSAVSLDGNRDLCGGTVELELPACSVHTDSVGRNESRLKLVIAVVSGVIGSALLLCVAVYCILGRSRAKSLLTFPSSDWNSNFSYRELEKATSGFSSDNLVGTGSFASVYKGLLSEDRRPIAVKVLRIQEKGISKIYMAECEALSNIRHRNLVKVLGCCSDVDSAGRDFKAIVLSFMPNGSLEQWLHPEEKNTNIVNDLNIFQRLSIAIDVASALEYLHCYCRVPIAHCDLKPGNVLLDDDLCAHLSDFGLAKFLRKRVDVCGQAQSSSVGIRGSVGYVAPEYGMGRPASVSGDVYSYGILLLEMFTGKRPTDELFRDGLSLHEYAKTALSLNHVTDIVDPTLLLLKTDGGGEATDSNRIIIEQEKVKPCLASIIRIGVACSQGLPQERMNIKEANSNVQLIRDTFF